MQGVVYGLVILRVLRKSERQFIVDNYLTDGEALSFNYRLIGEIITTIDIVFTFDDLIDTTLDSYAKECE